MNVLDYLELTCSKELPNMNDPYENLSDEELKEIFEDIEADYWVEYNKIN